MTKLNVYLSEETDSPSVVHSRGENEQKIVQHHRLVVKVELDGLVIQLDVGHLRDDVFEVGLAPGLRGVCHHGQGGIVVLFILVVQEDQFGPQVGLFSSAKNLKENFVDCSNFERYSICAELSYVFFNQTSDPKIWRSS